MPTPRMGLATAIGTDGTFFALGGNNLTSTFLDTVETYNPSTGVWSSIVPMPTARRDLAATASVVYGIERIVAVGGHGVEVPLTTVEVYTP